MNPKNSEKTVKKPVCVRARVCVRACVRVIIVCVCVCARACARVSEQGQGNTKLTKLPGILTNTETALRKSDTELKKLAEGDKGHPHTRPTTEAAPSPS